MPMILSTMHDLNGLRKEAEQVGVEDVFSKQNGFGNDVLEAMREMLVRSAA
jgi:hypothetical protein